MGTRFGERERKTKKKRKKENNVFIYRLAVYRSCRRGEIRWKFCCFLSVQADLFQELHGSTISPSPSSSTVWATSVGMLPTELNSRWLASGKLSVYTEKTCETENVAPMNEASPLLPTGNALMDPKSFDRSLFSFPLGESGEIFMHLVQREYAR